MIWNAYHDQEEGDKRYVICSKMDVYLKHNILILHIFTSMCKCTLVCIMFNSGVSTLIYTKGLQEPLKREY